VIFQYKVFSQYGYSSTKYSVSRDIPVQNIQSVRIFQYKVFSQYGYSSTKYSVSRDIPVQSIQSVPVRIFQYKIFSQYQYGYSSTKYSVSISTDIPVQNIQSVRIFQYEDEFWSDTKGGRIWVNALLFLHSFMRYLFPAFDDHLEHSSTHFRHIHRHLSIQIRLGFGLVIALTVCAIYIGVFRISKSRNEVLFNVTLFFTVGPRFHIDTCFVDAQTKNIHFFLYDAF
jgi:hypothetical protein